MLAARGRKIFFLAAPGKNLLRFSGSSATCLCNSRRFSMSSEGKIERRVAVGQMRATSNKSENALQVQQLVQMAKEKNANILFLPECCDFVGENRKQTLELSEPLTGDTMKMYQQLAKDNKIWLAAGGVHEAILTKEGKKTDKINNAHVVVNDCGDIVAVYRKLHLFDVDTKDFRFRESDVVSPGEEIVAPINSPVGMIGLQICYDVRFAEVSTILRKAGAEILTYPSAFAYATGKAHWEILLRARAIENQCYVLAPAQIGFHNEKRQSYGHAMIVEPWGQISAKCSDKDLDLVTADINLQTIKNVRLSMPCFDHRRKDIYALTSAEFGNNIGIPYNNPKRTDRLFAEHQIPSDTIFYETQHCFAFTNLRCVVPGHVLVSTKRIVPRLKDLNCDEISDLFQTVCKIQKLLENIYNTSSATVTVQDGPEAGQTVKHVHFHVMPRRKGDFEHNDQIYIDLQRLERAEAHNTNNRKLNEMIEEAELYRQYIKKC